jgi:hypothetical protein
MGHVLSDILSKGMREIDIYRVISNRYENKSMFLYYKEYTDLLQKKDTMKQSIIITLTVAMIAPTFTVAIGN